MTDEKICMIPYRVVQTLHQPGYYAQFWIYVQSGLNHREAYERLEEELREYGLPGRYESYESFRNSKSHYARTTKKDIGFW